jgi:tryptophanyl-tRNA synthetase
MKILSSTETYDHFNDLYNTCQIRYGDMKKQLAEDAIEFIKPFKTKINELLSDNDYLRKVVKLGAEKARESAAKTVKEVREIIGFKFF